MTTAKRCSAPQSYSRPRRRAARLNRPSSTISRPRPTMMRKLQNTIGELGQSARGQAFRPFTSPFQACVRIRLPSLGTSTAKRVVSACMSGQPNRISGAPRCVLKWPSMAAILAGWCSSVLRPCMIASDDLNWSHHDRHPHGHREHHARTLVVAVAQEVEGADRADHEGRGEVGRQHHVHEAVGKRRVEDRSPTSLAGTNWPSALMA